MRRHAKGMSKYTSTRSRRFLVICVVAIVVVFAIAATAISKQASGFGKRASEFGCDASALAVLFFSGSTL